MYLKRIHRPNVTTEKQDIQIWVNQTAVPVKVAADWTLGGNTVASSGSLVATASADAEVTSRNIPGMLEGHAYKVTVVLDAIDAGELVVTIGGVSVDALTTAGTVVYWVRPTDGNKVTITVDNSASVITWTISSLIVEALDPISLDMIPTI